MGRRVNVKVVANPAISRRAALLVCGELTSCFPPGQIAGRVTHEPDRVLLLSARACPDQRFGDCWGTDCSSAACNLDAF